MLAQLELHRHQRLVLELLAPAPCQCLVLELLARQNLAGNLELNLAHLLQCQWWSVPDGNPLPTGLHLPRHLHLHLHC